MLRFLAKLVFLFPEGCRKHYGIKKSCYCCGESNRRGASRDEQGEPISPCDTNYFLPEVQRLMVGNSEVASDFGRSFTKNKDEQQAQFSTNQYANVHVMIDDVHRSLHAIVQAITAQDLQVSRARCISTEWQNIGNVLDRFFFCLYVAVIIGSLITLSPKPQNTTFFWQDP